MEFVKEERGGCGDSGPSQAGAVLLMLKLMRTLMPRVWYVTNTAFSGLISISHKVHPKDP